VQSHVYVIINLQHFAPDVSWPA